MGNRGERFNESGYIDTTAHKAITKVKSEEHEQRIKVGKAIKAMKAVADALGFKIDGRITLVDKKTRREYK